MLASLAGGAPNDPERDKVGFRLSDTQLCLWDLEQFRVKRARPAKQTIARHFILSDTTSFPTFQVSSGRLSNNSGARNATENQRTRAIKRNKTKALQGMREYCVSEFSGSAANALWA
jgi:hypothetical protein